jgi:hypothetical protein
MAVDPDLPDAAASIWRPAPALPVEENAIVCLLRRREVC